MEIYMKSCAEYFQFMDDATFPRCLLETILMI